MRILICDDEKQYTEQLEEKIKDYIKSRGINAEITASGDPESIIKSDMSFDLVFLDVQMPINGISLAKELKKRNNKMALFFVTNYDSYQDEAMDLRALRYFEKPLDTERLNAGLDKALEYISEAYVDLFLPSEGALKRILVDEIIYVTIEERKALVLTSEGSYYAKESFDEFCAKLPNVFFYRVHKSFFVNLHYVESYSYSELLITDGTSVPIAPRRQSEFRKFWFEYLRRR